MTMMLQPALRPHADREQVTLEQLSCMDVIIEPVVVNGSRIGIMPRYVALRDSIVPNTRAHASRR
jgi:hypothetical protein